jgi:rubrerythrin
MRRLDAVLRNALLVAIAACGGRVDSDQDLFPPADDSGVAQDAGGGADALVHDASVDVTHPDASDCRTVEGPPDVASCGYELTLVDPDACEWGDARNEGSPAQCAKLCGNGVTYCQRVGQKVSCIQGCTGRRPAGLDREESRGDDALGLYLASAAQLERASVDAFRIAKAELAALGAPRGLVRACGRAARDEVRHARVTGALARRHRARAGAVRVAPRASRTAAEIALENAVEGCVRETFGAMLAMYQAAHARDRRVRAAMKRIARDEAAHARLAWRVAHFLEPRLSSAERARVRVARDRAAAELAREVMHTPALDAAGLPSPELASQMVAALAASLWAA